jgi:hypothetical protein
VQGLDFHRLRGENIIFSDEAYSYRNMYDPKLKSPDFFRMLRIGFDGWKVTVVPTYRRYYEWYLSCLKEINRRNCLLGASKDGKWPHEGGSACKNLWTPIQNMLKASRDDNWPGTKSYTNIDKSIPYWRNGGFPVSILNFHSPRHITCTFYCDIIHNTPTTCQLCLKQRGTNQNPSSAALTAYDDIVFEAANRGVITSDMTNQTSRSDFVADLVRFHTAILRRKGMADFPLICPPKDRLEALLTKSLAFEKYILPEFYASPEGEVEHRESFWKLVEEKVFCWVDKETLLNGKESWSEVLGALNATRIWPIRISSS